MFLSIQTVFFSDFWIVHTFSPICFVVTSRPQCAYSKTYFLWFVKSVTNCAWPNSCFCPLVGSNPTYLTLFVVLCRRKGQTKVHQLSCPENAKIGLRFARIYLIFARNAGKNLSCLGRQKRFLSCQQSIKKIFLSTPVGLELSYLSSLLNCNCRFLCFSEEILSTQQLLVFQS